MPESHSKNSARLFVLRAALVYLALALAWSEFHKDPLYRPPPKVPPVAIGEYTEKEIQTFLKASMAVSENYGMRMVRRWDHPVGVSLSGDIEESDREEFREALRELNASDARVALHEAPEREADVKIWIGPTERFQAIVPESNPGDTHVFRYWHASEGTMRDVQVLLDGGYDARARAGALRWGLLVSLGLVGRLPAVPESVLGREEFTEYDRFSPTDLRLLRMLYDPAIEAGFSRRAALSALRKA